MFHVRMFVLCMHVVVVVAEAMVSMTYHRILGRELRWIQRNIIVLNEAMEWRCQSQRCQPVPGSYSFIIVAEGVKVSGGMAGATQNLNVFAVSNCVCGMSHE